MINMHHSSPRQDPAPFPCLKTCYWLPPKSSSSPCCACAGSCFPMAAPAPPQGTPPASYFSHRKYTKSVLSTRSQPCHICVTYLLAVQVHIAGLLHFWHVVVSNSNSRTFFYGGQLGAVTGWSWSSVCSGTCRCYTGDGGGYRRASGRPWRWRILSFIHICTNAQVRKL